MSLITLFSHKPQRLLGPAAEDGGLPLDAVLTESIEHNSKVTEFPIEIGADINDHVIAEPEVYVMTGIVSDTPITWGSTTYESTSQATRSLSAYEILQKLWLAGTVFSIKTGYLEIQDVVIQKFSTAKDTSRASVFEFSATIKKLNLVSIGADEAITGELLDASAANAAPEADAGEIAGATVKPRRQTAVLKFFNSVTE